MEAKHGSYVLNNNRPDAEYGELQEEDNIISKLS